MQLSKLSLHIATSKTDLLQNHFFRVCLTFFLCLIVFTAVLLFGGEVQVNPAHPKQIGSIDPCCRVTDVIKGRSLGMQHSDNGLSQLCFTLIKQGLFDLQMRMKMHETYVTDTT